MNCIEYRKFLREAREQLVEAYRWSRDRGNTPEETVHILTDAIGSDSAKEIVSACILTVGSWDERISDRNRKWAKETCEHSADDLSGFYCPDAIHRSHMDQIADVFRRM